MTREPDGTSSALEVELVEISIDAGNPGPAELAAVTAVLTTTLAELQEHSRSSGARVSAWQHSQRPIRSPLTPGYGAWRGFSG
ncbi:MAG: acyl-CoA carboxylase subunit epsilon [Microbacteriaceae bacterium]|nr:acyl-CoA carboxylase subunit epsilon [Microbacteriaceae bacterium]